jgi:hypothetical protein
LAVFLRCLLGQDRKGIASALHALDNNQMLFSGHHGIYSALPLFTSIKPVQSFSINLLTTK